MSGSSLIPRLEAATRLGDPTADAVVAAFARLPGGAGWAAFERALAGAPTTVTELGILLDGARDLPAWLDPALADRGAVAFWRVGSPALFLALTYGSLAFGYQDARLSRPLAATGRLERMAARRLAETSRWVVAATAPGGLRTGAGGWAATLRVRLVHALVRARLRRSDWWDADAWGEPISAADGFATAIGGFCVIPMRALADLGVRFSAAEEDAIVNLWATVGFLMGVPEDLLPRDAAAARASVAAVLTLSDGPCEDSPRLMRALLERGLPLQDRLPGPAGALTRGVGARIAGGFTRRWMGHAMADRLDVPRLTPAPLVPLLRPAQRVRDLARASGMLGSDERLAALELAAVRRFLTLTGAPVAPVAPPDVERAPLAQAA